MTSIEDAAEKVAVAHTDLNVFAGIVVLLEGGLISADSYEAASEIIRLCKRAQDQSLARYDRAVAAVAARTKGGKE